VIVLPGFALSLGHYKAAQLSDPSVEYLKRLLEDKSLTPFPDARDAQETSHAERQTGYSADNDSLGESPARYSAIGDYITGKRQPSVWSVVIDGRALRSLTMTMVEISRQSMLSEVRTPNSNRCWC
jgi:hypothetical protein